MRAYVKESPEGPVVRSEVPRPVPGPGEFLLQIHAFGVGIHDEYFLPPRPTFPYPIGIEAAGVIEEVGGSLAGLRVGERVAAVSVMQPKGGTWAEYAAVEGSSLVVPIPQNMSFAEAAGVPVAGNTALKAVRGLPLPEGSPVFIAGGSGAIGTLLIQLAKEHRWSVAASASEANLEYMSGLGADLVVNYHDPSWPRRVTEWSGGEGASAAIAIPPGTSVPAMSVVRDHGTVMSISADRLTAERGITPVGLPYQADVRTELERMMRSIVDGDIILTLEHVLPFDEALAGLARTRTFRARGKQVVTVIPTLLGVE